MNQVNLPTRIRTNDRLIQANKIKAHTEREVVYKYSIEKLRLSRYSLE